MTDLNFGLDADLAKKRESLYDRDLENDTRRWIESVTGEAINGDFFAALKSGQILCKLANKLRPGSCKAGPGSAPFIQMENINSFLNYARLIGVQNHDIFVTVDLYELKNPNQVIQGLQAVKRITASGGKPTAIPVKTNVQAAEATNLSSFCPGCGNKAAAGAKFCGGCGKKL
ncbi:calponin (CH) domain-containing protein [Tieghemostelium lacteum]|uniref:Calponin (CH) domain-containing protein n=1 Tax=Tieghemostelium lacteum TaxID=361077 RepID=A0A151Z8W2_TIELA|nr:calponin (CH) domain-containing protein [Tieghemostelium lacteum]|eukprot:KYQ90376.1 calponin (CH) domain-containing protein [Tieghemostelium lacteum]